MRTTYSTCARCQTSFFETSSDGLRLRRFKAEKANIIGCNDQVASSTFKKGLPTEHELHPQLSRRASQLSTSYTES
ncbi:unnamed protein product [Prunus armeniaca]